MVYTCTGCGETKTEDIPAGHIFGDWTVTKEAACKEAGSREHTCTVCGEVVTEEIPALEHDWGEWKVTKEATCTETGEREHICKTCEEKEKEEIEKKEHRWNKDTGAKDVYCLDCKILKVIADGGSFDFEIGGVGWIIAGNAGADVESAGTWEAMFAGFELTGNWAEDLIMIAKSQIGYRESTANYAISETLQRKGYSRYGAWYGVPYGDWCAMFVSFCLHYAHIEMPYQASCQIWISELKKKEMFAYVDDYTPRSGDLIFYDYQRDGVSDHVGIVESVDDEEGVIHTIEGNYGDVVTTRTVSLTDRTVMGYGILPENPEQEKEGEDTDTMPAFAQSLPAEGGVVTVKAPEGVFPEDADTVRAGQQDRNIYRSYEKQAGHKIKYTVEEVKDGTIIPGRDGIRPESVTVKRFADGEDTNETPTLSEENGWTDHFTRLIRIQNNKKIKYTVEEEKTDVIIGEDGPDTYAIDMTGDPAGDPVIITNTHTPETVTIRGKKTWNDENDRDGIRPERIVIRLMNGSEEVDSVTVTADNDWAWEFRDLPKYNKDGKDFEYFAINKGVKTIPYSIKEDPVEGYTTTVTEETVDPGDAKSSAGGKAPAAGSGQFIVTNTHLPEKTQVKVTKVWDDAEDHDGIRPDSVRIKLIADGKDTGRAVELNRKNKWTASFDGLYVYTDGKPVAYTVEEVKTEVINGKDDTGTYAVRISGDAKTGYTITNIHTP